jgi:hypothetical protein
MSSKWEVSSVCTSLPLRKHSRMTTMFGRHSVHTVLANANIPIVSDR